MLENRIPVIIIFAPTACGKTAMARNVFGSGSLSVFKEKGEVVSADSQAVYIGMDIGTAKPSSDECKIIPHHLINLATPEKQFGLGEWMDCADRSCREIWSRKKIPIVVGGTGFYLKNFILGMTHAPESNPEIRNQIKSHLAEAGKEKLYAELQLVDSASATKINRNDEYRICRALEVYYTSGKPLSFYEMPKLPRAQYDFCTIILTRQKEELYKRIDERVEIMFNSGLEKEVQSLISKGYTKESPGMKAIGYSEFFNSSLSSIEEIKAQIKLDSHHYAKKQYTYMRGIPGAVTIPAEDESLFVNTITPFCEKYL